MNAHSPRSLHAIRERLTAAPGARGSGRVLSVGDGIAQVAGLGDVMAGEMLEFADRLVGVVFSLEADSIGAVLLGQGQRVRQDDVVRRTGRLLSVPVGDALLGRVVDALGRPLDGKGPIATFERAPIERKAPGIADRQRVREPLRTGIKAIDALIPIGQGQRELVIGDRQTGKTALVVDAILNQRDTGVLCVYNAIGQKQSTIAHVVKTLERENALRHSIVVAAGAAAPAALLYISPYAATAMGEFFRDSGRHALCIYDDLSHHAQACREMSLFLRRPPGREAYPGDMFSLHARLLERAAQLRPELGGGSLTALPIVETQAGDLAGYIPTNAMSMTDGQIVLESNLSDHGGRPAIDIGHSVSRVGGAAQTPAMRQVAGTLRFELAQYRELAAFTQFSGELSVTARTQLERGERLTELLKQPQHEPVSPERQVALLYAGTTGALDHVPLADLRAYETGLYRFLDARHPALLLMLEHRQRIDEEIAQGLDGALEQYGCVGALRPALAAA
jgi:F-type H+/Na+-transporting ATPase subunit alpha